MGAISTALPECLALRKRTGADQWDEVWDGVLHMAASPTRGHQDVEGGMEHFLRGRWVPRSKGRVYHQINVASPGSWPRNFRIPDLVLLLPHRFHIDRDEYFEGGPDVAVEIHSPGDEAYEKLPFYFEIGVREVWIVHRDTLQVEIYVSGKRGPRKLRSGADGWLTSPVTDVQFRTRGRKLVVRIAGDAKTQATLP